MNKRSPSVMDFILYLLTTLSFLLVQEATADIAGEYRIIQGTPIQSGREYSGVVTIAKAGDAYKVNWKMSDGTTYEGLGVLDGDVFSVGYSLNVKASPAYGVVSYLVRGTKLEGKWVVSSTIDSPQAVGRENLEGPEGLNGTYSIVSASRPGGTGAYSGEVAITKNGKVYNLNWSLPSESYSGIAIYNGTVLSVGWGIGKTIGVAQYKVGGGKLTGLWSIAGEKEVGHETLELEGTKK